MDTNFQNQAQAQIMSYYQSGYPAPIPAQQSPSGARPLSNASVSIWAGDLDSYMDETFLRNAVAACGWAADITRIKVVRDRYNGMHAGYGFLDAASPEAAARVLATGSGMPIPGTNRCWRLNMGRNAQGAAGPPAGSETNVYVGDLEPTVTDFELLSAFRPRFPSTRHAKVVCNDFGQSRGFGFVRFANSAEAERAVLEMNGFEFHGKPIRLSPANGRPKGNGGPPAGSGGQPRGFPSAHGSMHMVPNMMHTFGSHEQAAPTNKRPRQVMAPDDPNNSTLFIGGTGSHVTEDVLWREFSIFGEVEAVRVPVNKTGFAFVRFKTRENAQRAKDELSGTHFISLNPHKPVRLEWASEQLAVAKPPQQVAGVSQSNTGYIFNQAVPDPGTGTPRPVTPLPGGAAGKGAAFVPSASSTLLDPSESLRMTGNPNTGGSGLGESEGPPSKRAAVGRTEYSTGNEPVTSAHVSGGEEFAGKGNMEKVPSMSFPWLSTPAAQPSSSPQ